ncbi:unnamed protein product [Protopolystoma xenopodis]|uniref:Uncharacterized protein n=1 Tax=Protopolystoma xenopodis TaxID=117903 RepID=A0A3S5B9Q7_9PLAT|nr:unnamed protein product [Protopolystoma xenopodis]
MFAGQIRTSMSPELNGGLLLTGLWWNILADAVSEAISFESAAKLACFCSPLFSRQSIWQDYSLDCRPAFSASNLNEAAVLFTFQELIRLDVPTSLRLGRTFGLPRTGTTGGQWTLLIPSQQKLGLGVGKDVSTLGTMFPGSRETSPIGRSVTTQITSAESPPPIGTRVWTHAVRLCFANTTGCICSVPLLQAESCRCEEKVGFEQSLEAKL